ncbi:MAG: carboxypeptidase-like regulatory domain-containing protein [Ignavibacteria bacterium]|nr:carboxypeptidase-like regulatory domain-containing protein [Ignavibacteria bacterium]
MKNSLGLIAAATWSPLIRVARRFGGRALFIGGMFLLLAAQTVLAGGVVKGRVFDKDTKDLLPGANVTIKGTSMGASSDLNGAYTIPNVPPGTYTVQVSYIGYRTKTVEVSISNDATVVQDFSLEAVAIEGQVFVVTGQAQGQMQAINQQLASNKIANIVSEARIQELPDFNAAAAIGRLPGVSTLQSSGEANKIVIRGLAPQYNAVAVSGIKLASTGSTQIGAASQGGTAGSINNDRSVDLTMVTPYMIKSIEVYKSLTPDMEANAIGGSVNMALREAPSGVHSDFMWQSGYTQKSSKFGNYRTVASVSDRFFDDRLGAYLLVNAEQYDRDADNMTASYTIGQLLPTTGYNQVQVTNTQLNRHKETRKRFGGNLVLDYKWSSGILRSINMFSRLNSNYRDYNVILDFKNNNLDFRYRSGVGTTDIGVNSVEFENDFGFMSVEVKAANTFSRNYLPESPFYQFRQTGGVSTGPVPYDTPPENLATQGVYKGTGSTYLSSVSLFSSEYRENGQVFKADIKVPLSIGSTFSGYIKVGGHYRHNKHTNDQSTPYADIERTSAFKRQMMDSILARYPVRYDSIAGKFATTNFTSNDSKLYDGFLDDEFGSIYWAADPSVLNSMTHYIKNASALNAIYADAINPGGWFNGYYQTLPNDYDYVENYSAAYVMAQMNVGPNVMVVGGIRYEDVASTYHAYNLLDGRDAKSQTFKEVTAHPGNNFLLPMVQMKGDITDWFDVRYSYTQTLARPDYHQLSPHYNISYDRNNVWAGNPNLKPASAFNHDLLLTFHSNILGLFSIGGFYKEMKDFTYYTQYKLRPSARAGFDSVGTYSALGSPPLSGATLYTYMNNQYKAYVRGYEADFQTRFWYLPFPFDGLLLGINYTHINSKATYPFRDEITSGRPPNVKIVQIDSTRDARLINQPNDILNAFVGYDYKGFSAKLSFIFQSNSVSYIGAYPEQDGFTADYFRIDCSVRQMLPWAGLQLFLDVNNLNNRMNVSRQISIGGFTNEQHYGLTANLGVRYTHAF